MGVDFDKDLIDLQMEEMGISNARCIKPSFHLVITVVAELN